MLKFAVVFVFKHLFSWKGYHLAKPLRIFHIHMSMSHIAAKQKLGHFDLYNEIGGPIFSLFVTNLSITVEIFKKLQILHIHVYCILAPMIWTISQVFFLW